MSADTSHGEAGGPQMNRRTLLKTVGVTAGAAAGVHYTDPVQDAQAVACGGACIIGASVATGVVVGWALREYEVVGSNPPAEGLTASAVRQQSYDTARTRKSTNASTFVDNRNIISSGFKDSLYAEGKVAAIQAINNGETESVVNTAAQDAADAHGATVQSNLLKTWNESVNELYSMKATLDSHPDATSSDVFTVYLEQNENTGSALGSKQSKDVTLADGSTMTVYLHHDSTVADRTQGPTSSGSYHQHIEVSHGGNNFTYLRSDTWPSIWSEISTEITNAKNNLSTWVTNIYGDVQSGDLNTADLLTPAELAEMSTTNSEYNQAVADLQALNVASNNGAEIVVNPASVDADISGNLASTGEVTFEAGTTVDPTADSYSYYFTYDSSTVSGNWTEYETAVDGGNITFTTEPYSGSVYTVDTAAGESVEVTATDFADNGDGTWTYDASADLETAITEVSEVTFASEGTETAYQTVMLEQPFDVVSITDDAGESLATTTVTQEEPHNDTNYITKAEWDKRLQRQEDLIDRYEESQSTGGTDLSGFDLFGLPGEAVALVAAGGAALFFGSQK